MQLHAFVLHLERATERRANAENLLKTCGVAGELWPAVDGAKLSPEDLAKPRKGDLFEPHYPFPLKSGEIGCFLSHRSIWQEIITRDLDAGLVFEDDAVLTMPTFTTALEMAKRHIKKLGYIQFQTRAPKSDSISIESINDSALTVPTETPVRATAQLISRQAAEVLVEKTHIFDRPVDTYVQSHWFTGLRAGVIHPAGVSTISDQLGGSTIQGGTYSFPQKLKREILRNRYRARIKRLAQQSSAPIEGGIKL